MKPKHAFIVAAFFFLLGFISLGLGWHGNASVNVAYPIAGTSVQFCGSASSGFALTGILGLVLGVLALLVALVGMILSRASKRAQPIGDSMQSKT
jgi:hypothetical protein